MERMTVTMQRRHERQPATLAGLLQAEMRRRELNQSELAALIGVKHGMVSKWLDGQRPSTASCDRIADALGYDVDYILTLACHRPRLEERDERSLEVRLRAVAVDLADDELADVVWFAEGLLDRRRRRDTR